MSIRSPFLRAMPDAPSTGKARLARRRLRRLVPFLLFAGLVWAVVHWRLLPGSGLGLYWLHDHVYLPARGWTWTFFYPWSLVWWGALLTILIPWLVSYFTVTSPIQGIHLFLAKALTANPAWHDVLIWSERRLSSFRPPSQMLLAAARRHAEHALIRLREKPMAQLEPPDLEKTVQQVLFFVRLGQLPGWGGATASQNRLVWARLYGQLASSAAGEKRITEWCEKVASAFPIDQSPNTESAEPSLWSMKALNQEMRTWAALHDAAQARRIFGAETAARPAKLKHAVSLVLADGAERRRVWLAGIRGDMEWHWNHFSRSDIQPANQFLEDDLPSDDAEPVGLLALELALAAAVTSGIPEAGIRMVEEMDGLRLTASLLVSMQPPRRRGEPRGLYSIWQMVRDSPTHEHYLWCARLQESAAKKRIKEWKRQGAVATSLNLVSTADDVGVRAWQMTLGVR